MKTNRIFLLTLVISLISLLGMVLVYGRLPETIPTSFGFDGTIHAYGPRRTIFYLGALPMVFGLVFWLLPKVDPRKENYGKHKKAYEIIWLLMTGFCIVCGWAMVGRGLGYDLKIQVIIPVLVGVLFLVLGNYMPQVRSNYFMGVRTPWALDNEYVWKKTQKFGGMMLCVMGMVFLLMSLMPARIQSVILVPLLLIACFSVYPYSYWVYRKTKKNQE